MRVIAGTAKGRPLAGPAGPQTRPTSDKVKGALFSMLENLLANRRPGETPGSEAPEIGTPDLWKGCVVLDLYAGTGALGIEALSRGAAWCDFVESNPAARKTIERNLRVTSFASQARLIGLDARKALQASARAALRVPYAVVLLDPPYADTGVGDVLVSLATADVLVDGALVAVEHSRRTTLAERLGAAERALVEVRRRRHGDTELSIYRFGSTEARIDDEGSDDDDGDLSGQL